jgi:uncharacterized protein (DUF2147 family)
MPARSRAVVATACFAYLGALTAAAGQDGPAGNWLVQDRGAMVRIVDCAGQYWGVVAWEKTPGIDRNNPDPALRARPTLGMPVLLGMTADGRGQWSGRIYNAENGQTYDSHIKLTSANTLQVEGCVLGFMCGGETWSRAAATAPAVAQNRRSPGRATTGAGRTKRLIAEEPAAQVCSGLGRR